MSRPCDIPFHGLTEDLVSLLDSLVFCRVILFWINNLLYKNEKYFVFTTQNLRIIIGVKGGMCDATIKRRTDADYRTLC